MRRACGLSSNFFLVHRIKPPPSPGVWTPRPPPSGAVSPFPGCSGHMARGPCGEMDLWTLFSGRSALTGRLCSPETGCVQALPCLCRAESSVSGAAGTSSYFPALSGGATLKTLGQGPALSSDRVRAAACLCQKRQFSVSDQQGCSCVGLSRGEGTVVC